jgi:methyltransferase-like protein/cyclopropane fatty-acyl-phospholipid synthase-like methyltransferase
MVEAQLTSYEDVPYTSKPLYPTHPDCLATLATLLGMRPAAVDNCRVLELGCASGGNLIPMAASLPESRFLGIDLSPRQISQGQAVIDAVGIANIELRPLSILDVDASFGQFDYIICHGVYSWVPPAVQDKILDICRRNLAPGGVAYVSYNTYPGWHARGMVREMMCFHAMQFADPATRVAQARAFLDFLVTSVPTNDKAYARAIADEAELVRPEADYYLFHEHLEEVNQPLYFHQFAERLAAKGLQYLGEAWFHTNPEKFPPDVQEVLGRLSTDLVSLEQYVDFLENRTFRRTLLCQKEVRLDRAPSLTTVENLQVGALVRPVSPEPDLSAGAVEEFRSDDGSTASTNIPMVKAALLELFAAWPMTLSFEQLWTAACDRLKSVDEKLESGPRQDLAEALLRCYLSNMVSLHVRPGRFVVPSGDRPKATALARHQAATGAPIANLRHRLVHLQDGDRAVLAYLDGSRDRSSIATALAGAVANGALVLDGSEADGQTPVPAVSEWLSGSLDRLARSALLVQ